MHEVTAYVPDDDDCLFHTEKGARLYELRALLREATQGMPTMRAGNNDDIRNLLLQMLTDGIYPTVADKLLEAIDYFKEHRAVLRGPGRGN